MFNKDELILITTALGVLINEDTGETDLTTVYDLIEKIDKLKEVTK
jgi:hypothetical protein